MAPATLQAIAHVESGDNPWAIHVNAPRVQQPSPRTARQATRDAEAFIARGYSVDIGLMQVNSRHLADLGMTVAQLLDPCRNLRAAAAILTADYAVAARVHGEGQLALQVALSAYNTGDFQRGFANGYVARYYARARVALATGDRPRAPAFVSVTPSASPSSNPFTTGTTVFAREATHVPID